MTRRPFAGLAHAWVKADIGDELLRRAEAMDVAGGGNEGSRRDEAHPGHGHPSAHRRREHHHDAATSDALPCGRDHRGRRDDRSSRSGRRTRSRQRARGASTRIRAVRRDCRYSRSASRGRAISSRLRSSTSSRSWRATGSVVRFLRRRLIRRSRSRRGSSSRRRRRRQRPGILSQSRHQAASRHHQ